MAKINSFEELTVWQEAMLLAESVYALQSKFPKDERFGLCDQLRRAVVSVPSNIAEGFGRDSKSDFVHFLVIARGSLFEVKTQLLLAERLGFLMISNDIREQMARTGRMLNTLISKLRISNHK